MLFDAKQYDYILVDYSAMFTPMAFNYWPLADAVLLFFLAWVIRYGAVLQQQSDETL